jgi:hypothetical protein
VRQIGSLTLAIVALALLPQAASAQILLEWELGMAWVGRNDVRAPSDGTTFSTTTDLETEPGFAQRMRVGGIFGGRHAVTFVYIPFSIQAEGEFDGPVDFEGVTFQGSVPTLARYTGNTGRLSYRYGAVASEGFRLRVGGSAALRDTKISLENAAGEAASLSGLDFLPLLAADVRWFLTESVSALADVEGMILPEAQGLDVLLAVDVEPADRFRFRIGYRAIHSKVDRNLLYNSLLTHHVAIGISMVI